jgi:hypothetical protein
LLRFVQGKIVPQFINRYSKRRKVSIEVHEVKPSTTTVKKGNKEAEVHSYEECVVRYVASEYSVIIWVYLSCVQNSFLIFRVSFWRSILVPADKQKAKEARKLGLVRIKNSKGSNAASISGMQQLMEQDGISVGDADDESTAGAASALADTGGKDFDGWNPRYRIPCQNITIKNQSKKSVFVIVEIQKLKEERELLFDTMEEAQAFCDRLEMEKKREADRLEMRLKASLGGVKLPPMETITLLVEIVSAWDIPVGDFTSSDPYIVALLGRREVHKTDVIYNT